MTWHKHPIFFETLGQQAGLSENMVKIRTDILSEQKGHESR